MFTGRLEIKMTIATANILEKDGKKEFAVLPYEDFLRIQEELEDYDDLKELRSAKFKEESSETVALSALKKD